VQSQTSGAEHPEGEAKDFAVGGIMKRSLLAGAALAVFLSDFRLSNIFSSSVRRGQWTERVSGGSESASSAGVSLSP
jgi:hypothetical protein